MTGNSGGKKVEERGDGSGRLGKYSKYFILRYTNRARGGKHYQNFPIFLNVNIASVLGYFTDTCRKTFISLTF